MLRTLSILLLLPFWGYTQPLSGFKAHSHNDYEKAEPFSKAFQAGFESIEADVFLVNGKLLVGHELKELDSSRTLEGMYVKPIAAALGAGNTRTLQLLVDVKSDATPTLDSIVSLLKRFPQLQRSGKISIVISGNRPPLFAYRKYPAIIMFDGRPGTSYLKEEIARVALISDAYTNYWDRNKQALDTPRIKAMVDQAHKLGKPFRFWANPDHEQGWKFLMTLGVDYINTDRVDALAAFLGKRPR